jgi:hypothetical protein
VLLISGHRLEEIHVKGPPFTIRILHEEHALRFVFAGAVDEVRTRHADVSAAIQEVLNEGHPLSKIALFEAVKRTGVEGGYTVFKSVLQDMVARENSSNRKGRRIQRSAPSLPSNVVEQSWIASKKIAPPVIWMDAELKGKDLTL